jgi:iron complex outermembrane receptor protein
MESTYKSKLGVNRGGALGPCLILAAMAGMLPGAALAQGVLEEVIVTAQKREQSAQDVGISITSFTGDQMETLGFNSSIDVASMSPGVHVGGSIAGQTSLFTIRGVTQNDFTDSVESPVAVYVDEGYIAMGQGQSFALFDLDRVEIAKGPQSTLFGRNATGGVIHYITRKPSQEVDIRGSVSYGSYNNKTAEAAIGGPIGDALSGRVAVYLNNFDEILNNHYTAADAPLHPGTGLPMTGSPGGGQDMWNDDTMAIRMQLLFEPNEDVDLLVMGAYAKTDTSSGPYQSSPSVPVFDSAGRLVNTIKAGPNETCEAITIGVAGCTPIPFVDGEGAGLPGFLVLGPAGVEDGTRPVAGGDFFGYRDEDGAGNDMRSDFAYKDLDKFTSRALTAKLTWDLDFATLTAVTDTKDFEKFVVMDVDAAPVPQSLFQSKATTKQFSQEIRLNGELDRARWVAGFYYLWINNHTHNGLALPANSPLFGIGGALPDGTLVVVPFAGLDANNDIHLKTNSYSLFGQVEYDLTDQFMVTAGLRGIKEKKDYSLNSPVFVNTDDRVIDDSIFAFPLPIDSLGDISYEDNSGKTLWAGKIQLDWKPNDDLLLYFGINRGVKAGSYNGQLQDGSPRLDPDQIKYKEEVLTNYEGGVKATLFGGMARLNGSVYYYDYKDYQAFVFVQSSGTVSNNDGRTLGTEWELIAQPMEGLDLMLSMAYFDAKVKDLALAPTLLVDVEPSFAPPLQFAGLARYEWPAFGGKAAVQGDFNYSDRFYYNIRNFDSQKYDAYVVGNLRVSYTTQDDRWTLAGFVNNLANEKYGVIGFDLATLCGCNEDYYGKPRWFGVTLSFNYQ